MGIRILLLVTLLGMVDSFAQAPPPTMHYVDLLAETSEFLSPTRKWNAKRPTLPPEERLVFSLSVAPHASRPKPLPLAVTLAPFDATSYAIEDTFIYELVVRNTDERAIAFPVSIDQHRFSRKMKDPRVALIRFTVDDAEQSRVVYMQQLFGSADVADSLIRLHKNDALSLRAAGHWVWDELERAGAAERDVKVRVSIELSYAGPTTTPALSANSVDVRLRSK